MIFGDTSRLALRNLSQAKLRTALTTVGVAIGVGSLATMVSLGVGLQEQFVTRFLKSGIFDSIMVTAPQPLFGRSMRQPPPRAGNAEPGKTSPPPNIQKPPVKLDDAALQKIAALDRVKEVSPNLRIIVEVKYGEFSEFATVAGVPMSARGEGVFQQITYGAFFPNDTDDSCMLSLDLARRLPVKGPNELLGKELTLGYAKSSDLQRTAAAGPFGGINLERTEKRFRIVGMLEREPGPTFSLGLFSAVMIPLRKAQGLGAYDIGNPLSFIRQLSDARSYSSVTVKVEHPRDTDEVEKKIKAMGFSAFSINDALREAKKAFLIMDVLLALTGSVALAVASLGIVNTMVMSILERTREIGIMKAIGGSDNHIRKIFLVEAALIGLTGGGLGIVLGWAVGGAINFGANLYIKSQGGTPENLFSLPWWLIAGGIAFAILVSLIAGSYPASRAARLDPIRALRHD